MKDTTQRILGIDPGTNLLGFAIIDCLGKSKPKLIEMDVLDMRKFKEQSHKLSIIYTQISQIVRQFRPHTVAIEAPFYGKDVQAMLKLGRAQGVAMAAVLTNGVPIVEYSPRSVKQVVTGKGNATKDQVAKMLGFQIEGKIEAKFEDATDALGIAFCHFLELSKPSGVTNKYSSWADFAKNNPNNIK
jgi:crossover junction endodeoxyribonuclease RuvC